MPNPTIAPTPGVEYLALEALSPEERKVFDLALDALARPATERRAFFVVAGRELLALTKAADALQPAR